MADRHIQEAIEIGKHNAEIIELVKNWCAHASVVLRGGVGLIEEMYGLPVGARSINCAHARGSGWAGMDLGRVALDFHDRNCVGCAHRQPVRIPNLSDLVSSRDAERAREQAETRSREELERTEVERRAAVRQHLLRPGDHVRNSLLDLITAFDRDPSEANLAALTESSRAVPAAFDEEIEQNLLDLVTAEHGRVRALAVLKERASDRGRLVATALSVLARHPARVALDVFLAELNLATATDVSSAAENLVWFAHPPFGRLPGSSSRNSEPAVLLAAHRIAAHAVEEVLRRWLRNEDKERRRSAALSVRAIMKEHDPAIARRLAGELIASFSRTDDGYNDGEAGRTVARILGEALELHPAEIDQELSDSVSIVDDAGRTGIIRSYISVFLRKDRGPPGARRRRAATGTAAQRVAFTRLTARFASLPGSERDLGELCELLENDYRFEVPWDLVSDAVPAFLGAAALACDELDHKPASPVHDPRSAFIKSLEHQNRQRLLHRSIDAALQLVTKVAREHPSPGARDETTNLLHNTLKNAPPAAERLRGRLVATLGRVGHGADQLPAALAVIYQAMMDRSVLVRGGAIEAYTHLTESLGATAIPDLLHQVVIATLSDPNVYVHQRTLLALEGATLPPELEAEAAQRTLVLAAAHTEEARWDYAALALRVWVRFMRRGGGMNAPEKALVLKWLRRFETNEAARLLDRFSYLVADSEGYAALTLELLERDDLWESSRNDLLDLLENADRRQVAVVQQGLVALAEKRAPQEHAVPHHMYLLLVREEAWSAAATVGRARVSALPDTTENRPERLRLSVLAAAAELEAAAASGSADVVLAKAKEIRELQGQIAVDDKDNADARGLFPPVRRSP